MFPNIVSFIINTSVRRLTMFIDALADNMRRSPTNQCRVRPQEQSAAHNKPLMHGLVRAYRIETAFSM
ncbi:UNVERIFIED_CONTAM: hypothetical protein Slati_0991800 [Sesamum latifolium]|uniref:Uncharacterized protein n=1 Tax=Sesamum latifolium TaxID=2727402 RepID=A0AAW2XUT0_9LAMI